MKLKIEIDLDNDAFVGDYSRNYELETIFEAVRLYATKLPFLESTKLCDSNGNTVGFAEIEIAEDDLEAELKRFANPR